MSLERIADLKKWVRRKDAEIARHLGTISRLQGVVADKDEVIRRLEVRIEDSERPVRSYIDIQLDEARADWDGRQPPVEPAPPRRQLTEKQRAAFDAGRAKINATRRAAQ